jgi:glutamate-1-semialdehyde 2,1-aminomutase
MTFFANNARGIELAEAIVDAVPCCEQVRFVTSGGEADMYAIRLARAYTGKPKILKFEGGYHGMSRRGADEPRARPQVNFPTPCPTARASRRRGRRDADRALQRPGPSPRLACWNEHDDIAAIIAEPCNGSSPPQPGFLQGCAICATATGCC